MSDIFTILEQLAQTVESNAVIKDTDYIITYKELWENLLIYRRTIASQGIGKGLKVLLILESNLNWAVSFLVLISLGAKVVPVSSSISFTQLAVLRNTLKPDLVVDKERWLSIVGKVPSQGIEPEWADGNDEVLLQPTSGSTGVPKYCVRTLGELTAEGISFKQTLGLSGQDVILNALPLHHSYSLGMALIGGIVSGTSIIFIPRFSPRDFLNRLQQEKATVVPIVPIMAHYLVNLYTPLQVKLPDLRILLVGAGKIPEETYKAFYNKYGIWLSSNYGSTETGAVCSRLEPEFYPTVGRPMPGIGLEIRDGSGNVLPNGIEGGVWVNRCYEIGNALTKKAFIPMGDLGYLNKNGTLQLTGRTKSMINVGGKKVNPNHVEEVLLRHPKVKEAAVVGIPRSTGEDMVKAVIVVQEEFPLTELRLYTHVHLADYEEPTIISYVKALPRNEIGKLKREDLISL